MFAYPATVHPYRFWYIKSAKDRLNRFDRGSDKTPTLSYGVLVAQEEMAQEEVTIGAGGTLGVDLAPHAALNQCLTPIFIGMHRNAPPYHMKKVPGYTIPMVS
jgi:hypothetical protein